MDDGETDPFWPTQIDGLEDGLEIIGLNGTDPTDSDTDGVASRRCGRRHQNGVDPDETHPAWNDTDEDGLADGLEDVTEMACETPVKPTRQRRTPTETDYLMALKMVTRGIYHAAETDPLHRDSDGDGIVDGKDANGNGRRDAGETDPLQLDSDGDGLLGFEDANQNGLIDVGETDPRRLDTDGGGVSDGQEWAMGTSPMATDDRPMPDSDGDGLPDLMETSIPMVLWMRGVGQPPDSDGDGLGDLVEAVWD